MSTQARSIQTRALIVRAAAEAFQQHGYEGASLADIAQRAGVTKGALYFHFASKADLAAAMIDAQAAANADLQSFIDDYDGDRLTLLRDMTRGLAQRLLNDVTLRAAMRLAVERGDAEDASIAQTYAVWERSVTDVARSGQIRGEVTSAIEPDRIARFLVASFTGMQTVSLVTSGLQDLDERLDDLWQLVLPALTPA